MSISSEKRLIRPKPLDKDVPCNLTSATSAEVGIAVAGVRPHVPRVLKPVKELGPASAVPSNPNNRQGRMRSPFKHGRDTMAATAKTDSLFAGIDVAKGKLDFHLHPSGECLTVANSESGLEELISRLKRQRPSIIAIKASGGFEAVAVASLAAAGYPGTLRRSSAG